MSNSNRFDIELAGQKIPFATSPENELKLRNAAALVNEQINAATSGGNRSIERAAIVAALKLAGEVLDLRTQVQGAESGMSSEQINELTARIQIIEKQVDATLETLSLPGAPGPIVP